MTITDNHVHLDLINDDIKNIINRAEEAGVTNFVVPGVCGFPNKLNELLKYEEVKICWGIYPKYAEDSKLIETKIKELENTTINLFAIGECGLDKRFPNLEKQIELFKKQIEISKQRHLPLIVHLVGHWQKAYELLKETNSNFILHSWNGSGEMAKEYLKIGAIFSLSASILKNPNKLIEFFKTIPQDKIIFETDSPDQKPSFVSGEQNEPSNLPVIVEKIKELGFA